MEPILSSPNPPSLTAVESGLPTAYIALQSTWRQAVVGNAGGTEPDYFLPHMRDVMTNLIEGLFTLEGKVLEPVDTDYPEGIAGAAVASVERRQVLLSRAVSELRGLGTFLMGGSIEGCHVWPRGDTKSPHLAVGGQRQHKLSSPETVLKSLRRMSVSQKAQLFIGTTNLVISAVEANQSDLAIASLVILQHMDEPEVNETFHDWANQLRKKETSKERTQRLVAIGGDILKLCLKLGQDDAVKDRYPEIDQIREAHAKTESETAAVKELVKTIDPDKMPTEPSLSPPRPKQSPELARQLQAMLPGYVSLRREYGLLDRRGFDALSGKKPYGMAHNLRQELGVELSLAIQMLRTARVMSGMLKLPNLTLVQAVPVVQARLGQALTQDVTYGRLVRQLGGPDCGLEGAKVLRRTYTLFDTVGAMRRYWPSFSAVLQRADDLSDPEVARLHDIIFPDATARSYKPKPIEQLEVRLEEHEITRRSIIRSQLLHLYETSDLIDIDLLMAEPQLAALTQTEQPHPERRRQIVSQPFNYDPVRIVLIYGGREAFGVKTFANDVFKTHDAKPPYVGMSVRSNNGLWITMAERPIYDNATYFHVSPDKDAWQKDLSGFRNDAIKLPHVSRLTHTTTDPFAYVRVVEEHLLRCGLAQARLLSPAVRQLFAIGFCDGLFPTAA